jgi:integrase/recombinase XerD
MGEIMEDSALVAQFESYLLTQKRVSQNTFLAYSKDISQLILFLAQKRVTVQVCTKVHLKNFLKFLKDQKISAKSISRKISAIKLFFEVLSEGYNIANCAKGLVFPKIEKTLPNYLSEPEIEKLFTVANRDVSNKGIRDKVMLYLLYATGMRVSELVTLTIDQLHFDTGFVHIIGKGGKERMVPLPKNILELLRFYLDNIYNKLIPKGVQKPSGAQSYLFGTVYKNRLKPMSRQLFWMLLKKNLAHAAIFKNISPHSLRHSLATHLLKNGADIRSLQMLLGHESLATVQIYTHLGNQELRKIYDKKHPRA